MSVSLRKRAGWEAQVLVTEEAVSELCFWQTNVSVFNKKETPLKPDLSSAVEVFCDASGEGYDGYMYLCIRNVE